MLPGQCSWSSQLDRPQTRTWHRTAWWTTVPSLEKKETVWKIKLKNSNGDQVQFSSSGSAKEVAAAPWQQWRSVSGGGKLRCGTVKLWNSYLTPWPVKGRPTARQRARGEAVVSCLSAGGEGRGTEFRCHCMCVITLSLGSWLNFGHHTDKLRHFA